jgi:cephalosporin hydroxylase
MTPGESAAWRPEILGWSSDILPWISATAATLPRPARVVEVGSLYGRSLVFWTETLRSLGHDASTRLVGVDKPATENRPDHSLDPNAHARLKANLEATRSAWEPVTVDLMLVESLEAVKAFEDGTLDLVFIDGSHLEADVRADIEAWRPKIRPGGLLSGHDYGWNDHPGVKAAVDALLGVVCHQDSVWWTQVNRP